MARTSDSERPPRVSRAEHHERTRTALLDSARRLIDEHGYHGVSSREIAVDAGVTERTLFRYFPTKASLVLDGFLDFVPELLRCIAARPRDEPPYTAVFNALMDLSATNPRLRNQDPGPDWRSVELPESERERWLQNFVAPLTETLRVRYGLPVSQTWRAEVWARASVAAMITGLSNLELGADGKGRRVRVGQRIKRAFDALDGRP